MDREFGRSSFWVQFRATLIRNLIRKKRNVSFTLRVSLEHCLSLSDNYVRGHFRLLIFQEILSPVYFLVIILILFLALPVPFYPEVNEPQVSVNEATRQNIAQERN